MARATIASALSTFVNLRPNYGDGANYWSVAASDRGALPFESFALDHALLLWGLEAPAAARVEYLLRAILMKDRQKCENQSDWNSHRL